MKILVLKIEQPLRNDDYLSYDIILKQRKNLSESDFTVQILKFNPSVELLAYKDWKKGHTISKDELNVFMLEYPHLFL